MLLRELLFLIWKNQGQTTIPPISDKIKYWPRHRHPRSNQIPFDIRATYNALPLAAIAMDFDK